MRVLSIATVLLACVASGSSMESVAVRKSAETCERYSRLLSSGFWRTESRNRAEAVLQGYVDPVISGVRVQLSLSATGNAAAGLLDGAIGLLELARAYDTVGCATSGAILARVEAQSPGRTVAQMLQDFAERIAQGRDLDKPALRLMSALSRLYRDIDRFEYQQDTADFSMKEAGERLMQAATATHKAKGTLKHIALSARQYVAAVHIDYLVREGLAESVVVSSSRLTGAPATVNAEIRSNYSTCVVAGIKAARQWDTISFALHAEGRVVPIAMSNLKGGEQVRIAFPVSGATTIELSVFNGKDCRNTNWLDNRFSATVSFLKRIEKAPEGIK